MLFWTPAQLGVFMNCSGEHGQFHAAWHTVACTGVRRR
jgi:hypothetical protein